MTTVSLLDQNDTDVGNAERLVSRYRDELRFVPAWNDWLIWDGCRWVSDASNGIMGRAKETIQALRSAADGLPANDLRRSNLIRHAHRSERVERLRAMVKLAESDPTIVLTPEDLDAHPWLLNVGNGTVNLRTGELLPHRREDYLTKLAPVEYTPGASFVR